MKDLINRMRLRAEDLHSINPASETVKCLSEGADALERLANEAKFGWDAHALTLENAQLRARLAEVEKC